MPRPDSSPLGFLELSELFELRDEAAHALTDARALGLHLAAADIEAVIRDVNRALSLRAAAN